MTETSPQPPVRQSRVRLAFLLLLLVLAIFLTGWIILHKLTLITNWTVGKIAPQTHIRFSRVHLKNPQTVHIADITIYSKTGNRILFQAKGITATANPFDLLRNHIQNLDIKEITVNYSSELEENFNTPSTSGKSSTSRIWKIDHLTCKYGTLDMMMQGTPPIRFTTKFALDLQNISNEPAYLKNLHSLVLWDSQASTGNEAPFLQLDLIKAKFSLAALKEKHLSSLRISGGAFVIGNSLQEILSAPQNPSGTPDNSPAWILDQLFIKDVNTKISNLGPSLPDIKFTLQTTLYNLSTSTAGDQISKMLQSVRISDFTVYSPLDPFVKVITLRSVIVRFSLQQILEKRIEDITILSPTIYICEDLFWYMDTEDQKQKENATKNANASWTINNLYVDFGKLVLALGGKRDIGLPWTFRTHAANVSFANLVSLHLHTALDIPEQDYPLPSYQLFLQKLHGDIRLAYPPASGKNNVVPTLFIDQARWRQYLSKDLWLTVTFDKGGINGRFGGKAYGGKVGGGFSFFFQERSPWIGWVYGTGVDLKQFTDVCAPQNIQLTGPVDFNVQINAEKKLIRRMKGNFTMDKPGRMKIKKLDAILQNIPPTWTPIKQSSVRIMLETLRDFDYTKGKGDFWFVDSQGILKLNLVGPTGARNADVVIHQGENSTGKWQER